MRTLVVVVAVLAAAALAGSPAAARDGNYPAAKDCVAAWNRSATTAQKASAAALHPAAVRVFARSVGVVPQCLVYFTTATNRTLLSMTTLGNTPKWTKPKRCPSPPAGVLAMMTARGLLRLV